MNREQQQNAPRVKDLRTEMPNSGDVEKRSSEGEHTAAEGAENDGGELSHALRSNETQDQLPRALYAFHAA